MMVCDESSPVGRAFAVVVGASSERRLTTGEAMILMDLLLHPAMPAALRERARPEADISTPARGARGL